MDEVAFGDQAESLPFEGVGDVCASDDDAGLGDTEVAGGGSALRQAGGGGMLLGAKSNSKTPARDWRNSSRLMSKEANRRRTSNLRFSEAGNSGSCVMRFRFSRPLPV